MTQSNPIDTSTPFFRMQEQPRETPLAQGIPFQIDSNDDII